MKINEIHAYLDSFINFELTPFDRQVESQRQFFKLDRIRLLLKRLGDPQKQLKIIHVAGTKGKGSTSAMTASILRCAGYRVGLYTSPHLQTCRERIQLLMPKAEGQHAITEDELAEILTEMKPVVDSVRRDRSDLGRFSFFEIFTAVALMYFKHKHVDFAVLETGLGGRLDATNVCPSMIAALTPVSLDHTNILGDTIQDIAREKAAIIKDPAQSVVLAPQERSAEDVVLARCRAFNIKPLAIGKEITYEIKQRDISGQVFDVCVGEKTNKGLCLHLLGEHQVVNASVAIGIVYALERSGYHVSPEAVYEGLATVEWPGRCEIIQQKPTVLLDCAHNTSSMKELMKTISRFFPDRKVTFLLGFSEGKDAEGMLAEILPLAKRIILTVADHPRAMDFSQEKIKNLTLTVPCAKAVPVPEVVREILSAATPEDVLVVTGSVFVVAEARRVFLNKGKELCIN